MTIGRPRQFDTDKALDKAMNQFWSGGYTATSLQHLLDCTKLSKSSLYQTFGNKEKLFVRCLEHYQQHIDDLLKDMLAVSTSGLAFIESLVEMVIDEADASRPRGCLLVNTANELASKEAEIAQAVKRGLDTIKLNLKSALQQARQEGDISDDKDLDQLSDYLVTGISGLRTMVKAGASKESLKNVADLLLKTLR